MTIKPAENVTSENYRKKAETFCELMKHDGEGYGVVIDRRRQCGPWAAWLDYRKQLGMSVRGLSRLNRMQVPALWPHLFDAARDKALDDYFVDAGLTYKGSTTPKWSEKEDA